MKSLANKTVSLKYLGNLERQFKTILISVLITNTFVYMLRIGDRRIGV